MQRILDDDMNHQQKQTQTPQHASRRPLLIATATCFALANRIVAGITVAQRGNWGGGWNPNVTQGRNGVPDWEIDNEFKDDVFTFVRIRYDSYGGYGRRGGGWATDYRDSDLNFSLRLQELTSLKVNPEPIVLRLTDSQLFDYPFIYIIEPGALIFSQAEVDALRKYCLNGGFLMVDDFWGDTQYENLRLELKRVFPDRDPAEVPLSHEIFQCVYPMKEKPQVPAINAAYATREGGFGTWERSRDGSDTSTPHYRAIYDDEGRIMVFICHNTDLADGWEREGENHYYFKTFSEPKAYPMGINIIIYAMTH